MLCVCSGDEKAIIEEYFYQGMTYDQMLDVCQQKHGLILSKRTLQRRLNAYGLLRRGLPHHVSEEEVESRCLAATRAELSGPGNVLITL